MLSPTPVRLPPAPPGTQYLVHVSQFDVTGLMAARYAALAKVQTPMCAFVDVGDALLHIPAQVPAGLLYGAEEVFNVAQQQLSTVPPTPYSQAAHRCNPLLIHRAIFNTRVAQAVAQLLPTGLSMEWLLYYFVAAWRGAQLTPAPLYRWQRQATGMHLQVNQAVGASALWLLQNQARVLATLRANHTIL